jgi:hypothetical protein
MSRNGDMSVERKARNEAIFRDANEEIAKVREQLTVVDGRTPFLCECDDRACREIVRATIEDYEAVRRYPSRFLIANGHSWACGRVVEKHGDYLVVEKTGEAARIAHETDPRTQADV